MSSLARRTLRTTAAAAGIAALGAGLAGTAMAAPADDDAQAPTPEAATSPGLPSGAPLAGLPGTAAVPDLADLPMRFVFQGPTVRTSAPSDPAPSDPAPAPDTANEVVVNGVVPNRVVPDTLPSAPTPSEALEGSDVVLPVSDQVGALSALDTAGLFGQAGPG